MRNIKFLIFIFIFVFLFIPKSVFAANKLSITVDGVDVYYESLVDAINSVSDNSLTTIKLLDDVEIGSNIIINTNKDIIIDGDSKFKLVRSFSADKWYNGQLFNVKAGAKLTLRGVIIDNFNNYTFDYEQYENDLKNQKKISDATIYLTKENDKPDITANMINNAGEVNIIDSRIENYFSTSGKGLINAVNNSITTISNSTIRHCVCLNGGLVIYVTGSNARVYVENGTLIDDNYATHNGGIFKIYNGAIVEMNGGTISNTRAVNTNGTVSMTYGSGSTFILNNGIVTKNSGVIGKNNGRNAPFYIHSGSKFIMNGGTIEDNYGLSTGGVDAPGHATSGIELNGGLIQGNRNGSGSEYRSDINVCNDYDLIIGEDMTVNGNIYVAGDITNNGVINGEVTLDISNTEDKNTILGTGVIVGDVIIKYKGEVIPEIDSSVKIEGQHVSCNTDTEIVARLIFNGGVDVDNNSYDLVAVNTDGVPEIVFPTRTGYTFTSWYLDKKLTDKWNNEPITEDTTLYAKWNKNKYVVSWDADTDLTISELYSYNDKILVPDLPEKDGYIFVKWDGFEEGMVVPDHDLEFKAIWEKFENPETKLHIPYFVIVIVVISTVITLVFNKKQKEVL